MREDTPDMQSTRSKENEAPSISVKDESN